MSLKIHSIESLGALDGPGVRTVVFMQGCPLKCAYCHNPDTWDLNGGDSVTEDFLFNRIMRMKPYFKNKGGVTFSGGEPMVQAHDLIPLFHRLKSENVHIAIDTSGIIWNEDVKEAVELADLVILDYKHTDLKAFQELTGGMLTKTQMFLKNIIQMSKPYWIRQVIIPGISDNEKQVMQLNRLTFSNLREKIELLPFHKMGMHKWEKLGKICPLKDTPEMDIEYLNVLMKKIQL